MYRNVCRKKIGHAGFGLVEGMIAAGLVVLLALTIAYFLFGQHRASTQLEVAGECIEMADSVAGYLKKDEASLFISSYGAGVGTQTFPAGLDQTADGVDRFVFDGGTPTPVIVPATSGNFNLTLAQPRSAATQPIPNGWQFNNFLNIKNSMNRMVALAASADFCCANLDMDDPDCGTRFYDSSTPRPGLVINNNNVNIDLALNVTTGDASLCNGRRLDVSNLPRSKNSATDFKVRVYMNPGQANQKVCESKGKIIAQNETAAPQTLLEYTSKNLFCSGGKQKTPSLCTTSADVSIKLKTVQNCETTCLSLIQSKACIEPNTELSLFNTFNHDNCQSCQETEPGAFFLCRIGEKNWMDNPANFNTWQPCERAIVHDFDGTKAGDVIIQYSHNLSPNNTVSQKTTSATITLENLTAQRAYVVDVRAVDTSGNIGPSFCGFSPSCKSNSARPHFVVVTTGPTNGSITDVDGYVKRAPDMPVGSNPLVGATATGQAYGPALNIFGADFFQCANGRPEFQLPVTYGTPAGVYNIFDIELCTSTITTPLTGTNNTVCQCSNGQCTPTLNTLNTRGDHVVSMTTTNECNFAGQTTDQDWCLDNVSTYSVSSVATNSFGSTPNFNGTIDYSGAVNKVCGRATLCPNIDGTYTPTLGTCGVPGGWQALTHSGCLNDPSRNFCAAALDPCGRVVQTPAAQYNTRLMSVPWSSPTAVNQCYNFSGVQVGGNICETGFCGITGTDAKCFTSCSKMGDSCDEDTDCDDGSYCTTSASADGPRCAGRQFTCSKVGITQTNPCTAAQHFTPSPCTINGACVSGTCNTTGAPCTMHSQCHVNDGVCNITVQGSCICPTNNSCDTGDCSLKEKYCPVLNSCTYNIGSPASEGSCTPCGAWQTGPWGACMGGVETRSVTCPASCCVGAAPAATRTCTVLTYSWRAGAWGVCTAPTAAEIAAVCPFLPEWKCYCDLEFYRSTQTRTVECIDSNNVIVADSFCDINARPETQQECGPSQPCPCNAGSLGPPGVCPGASCWHCP